MHEVRPIISGHRLVLSYNLIHTSPDSPAPSLPKIGAVAKLRAVLLKWSRQKYDRPSKLVTYLLKHKYSEADLKLAALKGEDSHKVAHLRGIIEETGFVLVWRTWSIMFQGKQTITLAGVRGR